VVTIDSDSEILPGTLRELVAPFQASSKVGAVAGRVEVLNRDTFIGSMLDVSYELAFDFGRAAQSAYGTVACCPGALSAFRREAILPHLGAWRRQRFWGRPVTHGEDQALTNIVLAQGWRTVYQRHAVIRTLVPERYRQLARMLLRWERSFVVEGFSFARFMFTRYRDGNRVLPAVMFLLSNLRLLALYAGLAALPLRLVEHPEHLPHYLAALAAGAFFTALYHLRHHRNGRFVFGVLYAFYSFLLLQWVLPWALVTVRDERWGTR
jgi:hyaluronan synthase